MTPHDPYDVRPSSDLPRTQPRHFHPTEDRSTAWLPMLLVVALLAGAGLYYVVNTSDTDAIFGSPGTTSSEQPQGSTVTKSAPSAN